MTATVEIRNLSDAIGAEVVGVDLSKPLAAETVAAMRAALNDRSVLVLHDQKLTPAEHVAASRAFGDLELHVLNQFTLAEAPEIFIVSNVVEDGRPIGAHDAAYHWHSDSSFREVPSLGSLFYCVECPPTGGETQFASMFAAFDALDAETRDWLEGKVGIHDYPYFHARNYPHMPPMTEAQKAKLPPAAHPLVRSHPETGRKAIFFNSAQVREVVGVPDEEAKPRLKAIEEFATGPDFVYTHVWTPGDMVFWDNRSSMHRARPFDDKSYRRRMHRTTLVGDVPFYSAD
jgi:taurine dioxygenase